MDLEIEQGREMARIIQEPFKDTEGREAALPVVGRIFLVSGIIASLAGVVLTILTASFLWLGLGIASLILGSAFHVLFDALAEIVILLKKLSGMPFKGTVSGMKEGTIHVCSECGSLVYPDNAVCPRCRAEFEKDPVEKGDA